MGVKLAKDCTGPGLGVKAPATNYLRVFRVIGYIVGKFERIRVMPDGYSIAGYSLSVVVS